MLDRMVGYRISPLLWAKVKRGLSAGRVQSVALRIVCDREEEIDAFIPEEYWSLEASLLPEGEKKPITAKLLDKGGEKFEISSEEQMNQVLAELKGKEFKVCDMKKGERTKKAPLPFTTSTLQQEASKALNFPISKTMRIAQQLYEGVDIKGQGTVGIITYLRTDSVRISEEADEAARAFISESYGEEYLSDGEGSKKSNAKIQDAHEAIRPTGYCFTSSPSRKKVAFTPRFSNPSSNFGVYSGFGPSSKVIATVFISFSTFSGCSVIVLTTAAAFPMLYDRKRNSAYPTYLFHCFLSAISYHTNFLLSISYEFNHKKYVVLILNHKFPC